MATNRPRVALIATGGSIATAGRHSLDLAEYIDFGRKLSAAELLAAFPEVERTAEIAAVDARAIDSKAIGDADWIALAGAIEEAAARDPSLAGVVLTHGTATLEETAYFLHLALKVDVPVVVTGAMRPPNGLSTDAGLNLVNAVRVAAAPAARGLGVLVVMNDEVQSAREVVKTMNYRVHTFHTPDLGVLGYADPDGAVEIYRKPVRRHAPGTEFDVRGLKALPLVDIVASYAGADGRAIRALAQSGSRGIVHAGLPPGGATPAERAALEEAARAGVLIVEASLAVGRVAETAKMREAGFIAADGLSARKARVLAKLALAKTEDRDEIRRMFREY
ncbi:MAG: asparaginase [Proteobacteria bacterium]|nr:asparaginase [Pseudomonadota bacterium]